MAPRKTGTSRGVEEDEQERPLGFGAAVVTDNCEELVVEPVTRLRRERHGRHASSLLKAASARSHRRGHGSADPAAVVAARRSSWNPTGLV